MSLVTKVDALAARIRDKVNTLSARIDTEGVPAGGTTGQVLAKASPTNYDDHWVDPDSGPSAYDVAVANGFVGTEAEWLASLQGEDGIIGVDGASAYEVAVANGFTGTEPEWLTSLIGADGESATIQVGTTTTGAPGSAATVSNAGTESAAVFNFTIPRGDEGVAGTNGLPGITDVHHGTNGATARPAVAVVYWIGTATPANALAWDFWLKENI